MKLDNPCLTIFSPKFLFWRQQLMKELAEDEITPGIAGSDRVRVLRILARSRPLTISAGGLLGIPKDTAELGLLPTEEALVEVVAYAEIIEIWDPARFLGQTAADGRDFPELLRQLAVDFPGER